MNPGPDAATLQKILDGQSDIKEQLNSIERNQTAQKAALEDLTKRMSSLEAAVAGFPKVEAAVDECKKLCDHQERSMQSLMSKVDDLDNRSRRCNLIFYGIADSDSKEPWSESEKHVKNICTRMLKITPQFIERAHRIGKFIPGKNRPVIANFASYKEKQDLLMSAKNLKGTDISLSEDFSPQRRTIRRRLWKFAQEHKTDDTQAIIKNDTLYLNKTKYVYDESTKEVVRSK